MMSRRSRSVLRGIVLGVLVTVPAFAAAPVDQYEEFTLASVSITDAFTRLQWERRVSPTPLTFAQAQAFCSGGYRLPTLKELLTLVDEEPHQEYEVNKLVDKMIDQNAFPKTPTVESGFDVPYWTETRTANQQKVWTVSFATGETDTASLGDSRHVRCVLYKP